MGQISPARGGAMLALGATANNPIRTAGVSITPSVNAGVASAFSELLAPVSVDNYLVGCSVTVWTIAGNQNLNMDFAWGSAGAENVKLMVPISTANSAYVFGLMAFPIPLHVPPNTRLSVRLFTVGASNSGSAQTLAIQGMLARSDDFKRV